MHPGGSESINLGLVQGLGALSQHGVSSHHHHHRALHLCNHLVPYSNCENSYFTLHNTFLAISPHIFGDRLSLTSTQFRSLKRATHVCRQEPSVNLLDQEHPEKYQNSDVLLLQQAILALLQLLCNQVDANY